MRMKHEIFEHWWEYFVVPFWGFSNPSDTTLLQRELPKKSGTNQKWQDDINALLSSH